MINPGNPTGNSLPYKNMVEVVQFCAKHNLVLMADEVYQENVWENNLPFYSFKKVLMEMSPKPDLQLVSLHSTSKKASLGSAACVEGTLSSSASTRPCRRSC